MSGDVPHVVLVGDETRRLVDAIGVVAGVLGEPPTIVGGVAVLCRVQRAHRATSDLDALDLRRVERPADHDSQAGHPTRSILELLRASPGAKPVAPAAASVITPSGPVRVDVIDVLEVPDSANIEDPTDRLYEMAHAWAFRTATEVRIDAWGSDGSVSSSVARVAEAGPLVAMKLQSVLLRSTAKEGTDLHDIVTILLDPVARDAALSQLVDCDPTIAADAALHAERWFVAQVDRTLRLIRTAGAFDVGRDDLDLVADLLRVATRR
ncbi:prevent-host-death protein [Cellulomonas sp. PSBB021]|uniref:prevent-host-death protein n=1 Tax=Cellulomonas sp. PSBB021 TaxID=2003551 RepID=UPI0012FDA9E6|nr:prevent-host-death protein [Cellulomonas sp. PSBB021]